MDLQYSAQEGAFRSAVKAFLAANLPADLSAKVKQHKRLNKEDYLRWHKIMHKQGWVAPSWPKEYGGADLSPIERHILEEECALAGTPTILPFGINMVAPVIMAFGNPQQKEYYLPRILSGEDWWCQGYSEPGAGSDLASLKTRAERIQTEDGQFYLVNGQKTWTTLAQHADMIFCLVRTDSGVRKQEGISFLLIDMHSPGITVRPIYMLDEEHEVNEVFFDNVKVPVANLVGEENRGWTYAKYLLGHERTGIAVIGRYKLELSCLKTVALQQQKNGQALLHDPVFAQKVALLEIELMALEVTMLRTISASDHAPGPQASLLKIKGTELQQAIFELQLEAVGPYGLPFEPEYLDGALAHTKTAEDEAAPFAATYLNFRKASIYGGSNEIQRNIISQMILGL